MLLLLHAFLGCPGPEAGPGDDTASASGARVQVTTGEVATVVVVEVEAPFEASVVAVGQGADLQVQAASDAATAHRLLLAGFPAGEDVEVTVTLSGPDGDETFTRSVTTGALPGWVPEVDVDGGTDGFTLSPLIDLEEGALVIWNGAGEPVWAWPESGKTYSGSRARMSLDGAAVLYNSVSETVDSPGAILRIPLDGGDPRELPVSGSHTDFVELPDGSYATLVWDLREMDGRQILGDAIVEVSSDGETRTVWSVFDSFEPDLSVTWPSWYTPDPTVEDWSHINGLAYDPDADAYLVTMTFDHGVAQVSRTGELDWWFGTDGLPVTGGQLSFPHSVEPVDGGVLVFERGEVTDADVCSKAVTLSVDADRATRVSELYGEGCTHVSFLGGAHLLPSGDTMVTWSTSGRIDRLTPEDTVAWSLQTTNWAGLGFSDWTEELAAVE